MDGQVGVMIDVEKALYMLSGKNLHSAGLAFFSALGYPVEPLDIAINESMSRFVYYISKNHCIFGIDETKIMHRIASISWLFTLSNDIKELSHVQKVKFDNKLISSINHFCVELDCTLEDRSILAFNLTKIISKVVNSPVVVLFKHANQLLMSSMFMVNEKKANNLKTYLSDWYLFDPVQEDVLMTLSNWHFANYCDTNFHMLFMDLVYTIARPYFFKPDYGFLKFNTNSGAVNNHLDYDEIVVIDGILKIYPTKLSEEIYDLDPREFYGDDYVNDEESIEILTTNNSEWILDELFDQEEVETDFIDDEDNWDNDGGQSGPNVERTNDEEFSQHVIDFSSLDDPIFDDPLKMLEYINGLD